jgi:hypothetical protein
MRVTNAELVEAREALAKLAMVKMPVQAALAIARLTIKVRDQLRDVDATRDGLVRKHGVAKGNGHTITPEHPNWDAFVAEMDELMGLETEIVADRIKLPDCEVEPGVLTPLEKFIQ